jgi:hypothetical protein
MKGKTQKMARAEYNGWAIEADPIRITIMIDGTEYFEDISIKQAQELASQIATAVYKAQMIL